MKTPEPIYLQLSQPEHELRSGSSRFWGNPDLPHGMEYPMYVDDEGDDYPYQFICQINLEEFSAFAPENPLPKKGLLSFFAKIDDYLGYPIASTGIRSHISDTDDVKVMYIPATDNLREVVLVDDNDEPTAPQEMAIRFSRKIDPYSDEHALFPAPTHREWEAWDTPFEEWLILLQVDSFDGMDFSLNFMDCGVLDFLISPENLSKGVFDKVRAIVLST